MPPVKGPSSPHPWPARGGALTRVAGLAAGPCMAAVLLLVTGCSSAPAQEGEPAVVDAPDETTAPTPPPALAPVAPALDVEVLADGLDHPWDVARAPDGTLVLDERGGGLTAVLPDGTVRELEADFGD